MTIKLTMRYRGQTSVIIGCEKLPTVADVKKLVLTQAKHQGWSGGYVIVDFNSYPTWLVDMYTETTVVYHLTEARES